MLLSKYSKILIVEYRWFVNGLSLSCQLLYLFHMFIVFITKCWGNMFEWLGLASCDFSITIRRTCSCFPAGLRKMRVTWSRPDSSLQLRSQASLAQAISASLHLHCSCKSENLKDCCFKSLNLGVFFYIALL